MPIKHQTGFESFIAGLSHHGSEPVFFKSVSQGLVIPPNVVNNPTLAKKLTHYNLLIPVGLIRYQPGMVLAALGEYSPCGG